MDIGDITGLLALALSAAALFLGYRSDNTTRKFLEDIQKTRDREAKRVDMLIKHLMKQSEGSA